MLAVRINHFSGQLQSLSWSKDWKNWTLEINVFVSKKMIEVRDLDREGRYVMEASSSFWLGETSPQPRNDSQHQFVPYRYSQLWVFNLRSPVKGWCTPYTVQLFAGEGTQARTHFLLVCEGCPSSVCIALWPVLGVWVLKVLLHGHSAPLPRVCGERESHQAEGMWRRRDQTESRTVWAWESCWPSLCPCFNT